jgi:DNA polymerase-3 subunit gamma/tau
MAKQQPAPRDENYTVLARRYRPQTFEELVGQEAAARALVNALKGNRVAHAYLFTGARGVGKTSTARILAKALNCEKGPTPTPCNVCDTCRSITAGDDVDVIEIDGASNRRIDEIRDIRANVQYRPVRARYKIYIIDEVHMLVKEAFNALLKTLEEPPPHVKFIFATTEVQKIPITILSRCQRFDFAGISTDRILAQLKTIVEREGMQADEEALELVARRAGGSMRDAQSLLDQVLAFGDDRITADQVRQLLGMAGDDRVTALAEAVVAGDAGQALAILDATAQSGLQMGELVDQLTAYWRDMMVVRCAGEQARDLSVPSGSLADLNRHAKAMTLDAVLAGLDLLSATRARLRDSSHGRTLVETALVRLCRINDLLPVAQLARMLADTPGAHATRLASAAGAPTTQLASAPPEGVKKNRLSDALDSETTRGADAGSNRGADAGSTRGADATPLALTDAGLPEFWPQVLRSVGPLLSSDLEKAGLPAILGPNNLVLRFPANYNQSKEHCQEPTRLAKIEETLKKLSGRSVTVKIEGDAGPVAEAAPAAPPRPRRNARAEAEKEPLVQRAVEALGAQIVRVDEGFGEAPTVSEGS